MYQCPKCKLDLILNSGSYRCSNGHCFDVSSSGYVNLLLSKGGKSHGDNKLMLESRRRFLALGYYHPIIEEIVEIINELKPNKGKLTVLDAGCGEGYYTGEIFRALSSDGHTPIIYGIDVSKSGVAMASKKYKECLFSVASVNELPFNNADFDVVLSLFAPISESEFQRVLKNDGIFITVSPSPKHLLGLKSQIYERVYENEETTFIPTLFSEIDQRTYSGEMHLTSNSDINDLFTMTPYYYKTSDSGKLKVSQLDDLLTEIGFMFYCFKKTALK